MKVLILNGHPGPHDTSPKPADVHFHTWLSTYQASLRSAGTEIDYQDLSELDLKFCNGCWSCWWATPGRCALKDSMASMYPRLLAAEIIVWAHPLILGATPALVKKFQDRIIPLLHPYLAISHGEIHHQRRYQNWRPQLTTVFQTETANSPADISLAQGLYERLAINLRGRFGIGFTTSNNAQEAAHATLSA